MNLTRASIHLDLGSVLRQPPTFQAQPLWHYAEGLSPTRCSCHCLEPSKRWGPGPVANLPPRGVINKADHSGWMP